MLEENSNSFFSQDNQLITDVNELLDEEDDTNLEEAKEANVETILEDTKEADVNTVLEDTKEVNVGTSLKSTNKLDIATSLEGIKEAAIDTTLEVSKVTDVDTNSSSNTHKMWELAENLIIKYKLPVIPLNGKIPCIKEWQKKNETILEELNKWKKYKYHLNIGLPLGKASGIVAIDVDGEEGKDILKMLSNGIVPDTVTYTTPGGGIRYLYKVPDKYKKKKFKKFAQQGKSAHSECALLGDGQQTVLPLSIHPNGGIYNFVEGRSFNDIKIATMPDWMLVRMLFNSEVVTNTSIGVEPFNLEYVLSKCSKLESILKEQRSTGVDEETWFRVIALLVNSGNVSIAREFSELSEKHNSRSTKRIDELVMQNIKATTRCTSLGCSEDDVLKCFNKHNKNTDGEITNSPSKLIGKSSSQNQKFGFCYDEDGNFTTINGNIFARHILKNFDITTKGGIIFYYYVNNFWSKISEHKLKKILRRFFNSFEKDKWSGGIQELYISNLVLECTEVEIMQKNLNYINVKNGIFNMKKMALEPHNKRIFSTVQMPIKYNPKAECPMFIDFLEDIFEEDKELILLVQEILGYCLTSSTTAQKIFIFLGEGANGKSVLCSVFNALCGQDNVSNISLRTLSNQFAKAGLVDKLLNISTENELVGGKLNTEDIKAISSGDVVQIERKYENSYSQRLYAKLLFAVNRLPYSKDNSYALMRRLVIVPFNKTYVANAVTPQQGKIDILLTDKLLTELNGIFNFALEGLKRLHNNSYIFTSSKKSLDILEDYKLEINPFLDFIQSCIEEVDNTDIRIDDKRIDTKVFLNAFKEWCYENNHNQLTNTSLKRFLKESRLILKSLNIPFTETKSNSHQYFIGIKFEKHFKERIKRAARKNVG